MQSNILNQGISGFTFNLVGEDYWDFTLSDGSSTSTFSNNGDECLSAHIDFNNPNCIEWDDVMSKNEVVWNDSVCEDVTLDYFGSVGVDNGRVQYRKDRITNKEFIKLFTTTELKVDNDKRLRLSKVDGNNQIYDYSNNLVYVDDVEACKLNGGFYQGFFKIYDKKYQTLPHKLGSGWTMSVKLKKSEFENDKFTINKSHPQNKGMFLYIGTRAENKWFEYYSITLDKKVSPTRYSDAIEMSDNSINSGYIVEKEETPKEPQDYLSSIYSVDYGEDVIKDKYVEDGYIEKDEFIRGDEHIVTKDGIGFNQPNMIKFESNNKFLFFNRTKEGFTTCNWDEENKLTFYDIKRPKLENYHTLFHRGCNGMTVCGIDKLIDEKNKEYDILKDLYDNALGFQIKDDGSIGYKYLVKDCTNGGYMIEELFSNEGVIENDKWCDIKIRIVPKITKNKCAFNVNVKDGMYIYIYVNGRLKLKSKELPMINLRELDDLSEKQQGVPFNISLGGGTQGLCDVVNFNFMSLPKYLLPIEKEFCGSFIGYIKEFKFHSCNLSPFSIIE